MPRWFVLSVLRLLLLCIGLMPVSQAVAALQPLLSVSATCETAEAGCSADFQQAESQANALAALLAEQGAESPHDVADVIGFSPIPTGTAQPPLRPAQRAPISPHELVPGLLQRPPDLG